MSGEQWYDNKQLFEMFLDLKTQMAKLTSELSRTNEKISKYNGLREKIDNCEDKLNAIDTAANTKKSVGMGIQGWTGWVIAIVSFIVMMVSKVAG